RQSDRKKVALAPEEVIRVKVWEPLVSEAECQQVQRSLELKKSRRTKPVSRFTYNTFLSCSLCSALIYTKYRRDDYYVCKARHISHTCPAAYMRRDRLESELDQLFAKRLTSPSVLSKLVKGLNKKRPTADTELLKERLQGLETKRQRV